MARGRGLTVGRGNDWLRRRGAGPDRFSIRPSRPSFLATFPCLPPGGEEVKKERSELASSVSFEEEERGPFLSPRRDRGENSSVGGAVDWRSRQARWRV